MRLHQPSKPSVLLRLLETPARVFGQQLHTLNRAQHFEFGERDLQACDQPRRYQHCCIATHIPVVAAKTLRRTGKFLVHRVCTDDRTPLGDTHRRPVLRLAVTAFFVAFS